MYEKMDFFSYLIGFSEVLVVKVRTKNGEGKCENSRSIGYYGNGFGQ